MTDLSRDNEKESEFQSGLRDVERRMKEEVEKDSADFDASFLNVDKFSELWRATK